MGCGASKEDAASAPGGGGSRSAASNGTGGGRKFADSYKPGKTLGEGAFAVVKEAIKKDTNETYAVKMVTKSRLSQEDALALKDEISILLELKHPHIMRLYETFEDSKYHYLVTEQMHGGELFDRVVAKTYYNEKEARDTCLLLFRALEYLHSKNIAHRDLKPENLLLQSQDDDTKLKIADFGFAKKTNGSDSLMTQCGTPGYVAPEILEGVPYGTKSDMWSLGCITYILLGGYPPFTDNDQQRLFAKIRKGKFAFHPEYWAAVSQESKDLISAMLTVDSKKRTSAKKALSNSWVTRDADKLAEKDLGKNLQEFKKFNAKRKFKAAVKGVVAANMVKGFVGGMKKASLERKLTEDDIATLKETFAMFDKDGGGTISTDELHGIMKKLGTKVSKMDVTALIKSVDINNDGEMDFNEFVSMMRKMPDTANELKAAFKVFDADGSGTTSKSEMKQIMDKFGQNLSEEELNAVMKEVDSDGDGEINFEEFKEAMLA